MKNLSVNISHFESIVINFSDFLTYPCYKEANDVSL